MKFLKTTFFVVISVTAVIIAGTLSMSNAENNNNPILNSNSSIVQKTAILLEDANTDIKKNILDLDKYVEITPGKLSNIKDGLIGDFTAYSGDIRTLIPATSGQHSDIIRTAFRQHPDTLSS